MPTLYQFYKSRLSSFCLFVICLWTATIGAQTTPEPNYTLTDSLTGTLKTYVARDFVSLKPGFQYKASGTNAFSAKINEYLVCPAKYQSTTELVDPYGDVNTSLSVGALTGSTTITPTGGGTYQLPIKIPSGINGLKPTVNIVYNSQSGNGLLGYGWNLSALSLISRTGKTYYHDGATTVPNLTSSDNLLLNGQRLMLISGSNLTSNAKYGTEIETYNEITCKVINGFAGFEIKNTDGSVMEYGSTADSYIEAQNSSTPVFWLLSKVTDKNGNYLTYHYTENNLTGEFYLSEIQYTGNVYEEQEPTCKIEFFYESRKDTINSYTEGKKQQSSLILNKIRTLVSGNKINEYKFNYFYDSFYTKLTEVTEFGENNSQYNSTKIDWGDFYGEVSRSSSEDLAFLSEPREGYYQVYADFNADGKTDFISIPVVSNLYPSQVATLYLAYSYYGMVGFEKKCTIPIYPSFWGFLCGDFNGDGQTDVIRKLKYGTNNLTSYECFFFNGTEFQSGGSPFDVFGVDALVGDYNGDGIDEFLVKETNKVYNWVGMAIATGGIDNWGTSSIVKFLNSIHTVDFNGNGKTDILVRDGSSAWVYELNGSSFQKLTTFSTNEITQSFAVFPGDYNGDGKTDILAQDLTDNYTNLDNIFILFSNGKSFEKKETEIPGFPEIRDELYVGDFNRDGKSDVFFLKNNIQNGDTLLNPVSGIYDGQKFCVNELSTNLIENDKIKRNSVGNNYTVSDFDGDGRDEFCLAAYSDACIISAPEDKQNLLVRNIVDGMGNSITLNYEAISNDATYNETATTKPAFPVVRNKIPLTVVKSISQNAGGTYSSQYYQYKNLRMHKRGKGFLCFGEIIQTDYNKSTKTTTKYDYNTTYFNPYITEQNTSTTGGVPISTSVFENNLIVEGTKQIFPYVSTQTQTDKLTNTTQATTYANWEFGKPQSITKTFSDGISETTSIIYQNTINNNIRITGLPQTVQTVKTKNGQQWTDKVITSYNSKFSPSTVTTYTKDGTKKTGSQGFSYDNFGNVLNDTIRNFSSNNTAITKREYSSDGRLLKKETNPIGLAVTYEYDKKERLMSAKDHKNNVTKFEYDDFGRKTKQINSDGTESSTVLAWESTPYNAKYSITQTITGKPIVKTVLDASGREICNINTCFDGSLLKTDKQYDSKGRLWKTSLPYKTANPTLWNTYHYDAYNRIDSLIYASGKKDSWQYNSNTITTKTNGIASAKTYNSIGELTGVSDTGGTISYTLRPDGQPSKITAFNSVETNFGYDDYGRQTSINDPSAGLVSYTYDMAGNIDSITNANGKKLIMQYDEYSRLTNKTFPEFSTTYVYTTDGLLDTEISTNGISKDYSYDDLGRISSVKENTPDSRWLLKSYTYNGGNVQSVGYSANTGSITTENYYYTNGHLCEIKLNAQTSIWKKNAENNLGQPINSTTGQITREYGFDNYGLPQYRKANKQGAYFANQSYLFDAAKGNLTWQYDEIHGRNENMGYDNLNRLTNIDNDHETYSVGYDIDELITKGNIDSISNVGKFKYNHATKPYALTGATPYNNAIPIREQEIPYTSFLRPDTITENAYRALFTYNNDADRVKMQVTNNSNNVLTRYYIGNQYEADLASSGNTERLYIGGDAYSAPAVLIKNGSGSWNIHYLCRDYLGSITHVTDAVGNMLYEYSYDAWGRLRSTDEQEIYMPGTEPELFLGRGFTGHEHLPWFGLINMNARLYDPALGRFLSPDPYVSSPDFTQDYNRYSYARNNPFSYNDPAGEFPWIAAIGVTIFSYLATAHANTSDENQGNPARWNWNPVSWFNKDNPNSPVIGIYGGYGDGGFSGGLFMGNPIMPMRFGYSQNFGIGFGGNNGMNYPKHEKAIKAAMASAWERTDLRGAVGGMVSSMIEYEMKHSLDKKMIQKLAYESHKWMKQQLALKAGKKISLQTRDVKGFISKGVKYGEFALEWGGKAVGIYDMGNVIYDYKNGEIGTYSAITDFSSAAYSTFGSIYGAAWGVGWEAGRAITSTEFYQEAKFNFWYNMMERKLGPPSYNNRFAWEDYFYNYFKP